MKTNKIRLELKPVTITKARKLAKDLSMSMDTLFAVLVAIHHERAFGPVKKRISMPRELWAFVEKVKDTQGNGSVAGVIHKALREKRAALSA